MQPSYSVTEHAGNITVEPTAGSHLKNVARFAVQLATARMRPVRFTFNDVALLANAGDDPAAIVNFFNSECERRATEYRKSPEGQGLDRHLRQVKQQCQAEVNALIERLPASAADLDAVVAWLDEFTEPADHLGVTFDAGQVADVLEAHWREGAHVGVPPADFTHRMMGEYIVGQALTCLRRGMPPHPVLRKFAAEYRARTRG